MSFIDTFYKYEYIGIPYIYTFYNIFIDYKCLNK